MSRAAGFERPGRTTRVTPGRSTGAARSRGDQPSSLRSGPRSGRSATGGHQMLDWERNWRGAGIVFAALIIVASVIYGSQPKVGASADKLVSFYDGDRTRILIATVFFCFSFLELLWFGAALSSVLRDAGKGGWAAAATASSAAWAAVLFVRMAVRGALAFSIAGSGYHQLTSGLSEFGWVLTVILAFPAAMFVMSGAFGLW